MKSEVLGMRFLYKNTTIPLPAIHGFNTTFNNMINSPFIMMEKLEGICPYDAWHDVDDLDLEQHRQRTLHDLADYMV